MTRTSSLRRAARARACVPSSGKAEASSMALRTILSASSRCVMRTGGGLRPMRCSAARSLAICPWRWPSEPLISFSCACSSARRASMLVRSPSLFLMSVAVSSRRTLRLSRSAEMASTSPCRALVRCLTFSSSRCLRLERLLGVLWGLGRLRLAGLRLDRLLGSLRQEAGRRQGNGQDRAGKRGGELGLQSLLRSRSRQRRSFPRPTCPPLRGR